MAPSPPGLTISVSRRTCDNSPREGGKPEALEHWFVGQREQASRGRDGACRAMQRDVFALERGRQSGIAQPSSESFCDAPCGEAQLNLIPAAFTSARLMSISFLINASNSADF